METQSAVCKIGRHQLCDARIFFTCVGDTKERVVAVHRAVLARIPYFAAFFRQTGPFAASEFFDYRMRDVPTTPPIFLSLIESAYGNYRCADEVGEILRFALYLLVDDEQIWGYLKHQLRAILDESEESAGARLFPIVQAVLREERLSATYGSNLLMRFYDALDEEQRLALVSEFGEGIVLRERFRIRGRVDGNILYVGPCRKLTFESLTLRSDLVRVTDCTHQYVLRCCSAQDPRTPIKQFVVKLGLQFFFLESGYRYRNLSRTSDSHPRMLMPLSQKQFMRTAQFARDHCGAEGTGRTKKNVGPTGGLDAWQFRIEIVSEFGPTSTTPTIALPSAP